MSHHLLKKGTASRCVSAIVVLCLGIAAPGSAASPQIELAIKTLAKIEGDPAKFQTFCRISKELAAVGDQDNAKSEALERELEALLESYGRDVVDAWDLGEELDPQSEDGKAFEAAVDALEDKCPD